MIDVREETFLRKIHLHERIAGQVLETFAKYPGNWLDEDSILQISGLPNTRRQSTLELLRILVDIGILKSNGTSWTGAEQPEVLRKHALMAESVGVYLEKIHEDRNTVQVVVTKPPQPSALDYYLPEFGRAHIFIETTEDVFRKIATSANNRLVLLTPFFDNAGIAWILELFSRTKPSVQRILIVRELEAFNQALMDTELGEKFRFLNIRVLQFKIDKPERPLRYETFHAKALLADRDYCYVGSFNMTAHSIHYSMEMGIAIRGTAAASVAQIMDTIISIASMSYERVGG
jgi:hypothetical protein